MKRLQLVRAAFILMTGLSEISYSQNVGLGTATPLARLHVIDSSVLFSAVGLASGTPGNAPLSGPGRRMMWYSDKAAFRAGYVDLNQWDKDNIGNMSFASGSNVLASGPNSVAMGHGTKAIGTNSFAVGTGAIANDDYSVAIGYLTTASGTYSTALGYITSADGAYSTAMGKFASSDGISSVAIGYDASTPGDFSTAMGYSTTADGDHSTAMGNYVSTSGYTGAFVLGDNSTTTIMQSFVANGFRSRFAGGYRLLTNAAANLGVVLTPDATSWSAISDVRLKENFLPVNGEYILKSIAAMPLTTWNYKAQLDKTSRHYGPMAQDFYAAFGKDELGMIGCDTLINQQDFLGVNFIAIQALERRTSGLKEAIEIANETIDKLKKEIELLKEQNKLLVQLNKN